VDEMIAAFRRESAVRMLIPLFFLSGATALVYQTIWGRTLHLVFGTSQFAIATVLSAFMAGLALGGFWMSRHADRVRRPLLTYGLLELFIGAYALVFPVLLDLVTPIYLNFHRAADPSPLVYGLFQFALVGVLLLAPTTCMGATLPLLARFVTTRLGDAGDRVGLLYGVNTFGAVVGIGVAGFWLLPAAGLQLTTICAAVANGLLGAAAVLLSRTHGEGVDDIVVQKDLEAEVLPIGYSAVLLVAALAGFSGLVYEVAWFRLMALVLGASTYAFSTMLLAFLVGIAVGGAAGGRPADAAMRRWGLRGPLLGLAALQLGVAVVSYSMMYVYQELPFLYVRLFDMTTAAVGTFFSLKIALAALVMTPPALLMGATFPFLVRAAIGAREEGLGRQVGRVYGANTLGAIAGSALAGFVFLPLLNVVGTVLTAAGMNLLGALVAAVAAAAAGGRALAPRLGLGALGFAAAAALAVRWPPPWDPMLMTSAMYKYVADFDDHSREGILNFTKSDFDLLFYEEGMSTVVTVAQSRTSGNIWLANNGKIDASTTVDMPTQVLVTHLPALLVDEPETGVVIGLASGITLGAMILHDAFQDIQVVELEPAIVEASHFFDDHNHRPLEDPRVDIFANDGRNHLLLAAPETWDVVVCEPSNPWISGVSNLFTREFWEMGKARLKPGGVWGQWIQLYGMDDDDLRSLLGTFADIYPYLYLFSTIEDADVVMVASEDPLDLSVENLQARLDERPAVAAELAQVDITDAISLLARLQLDRDAILSFAGDAERNTDDNMRVEYSAPRNLYTWTGADNLEALLHEAIVPLFAVSTADQRVALAKQYIEEESWGKALIAARGAVELDPEHSEALALVDECIAALRE
jgi:spermidine synthase